MYFAPINGLVREMSLRHSNSSVRAKYMQYFLDGIRDDAKKLSTSMDNADWTSIWHGFLPTLSIPFRRLMGESISRDVGTSFSHAKGMYDNLNRFLQAAYVPEDEIQRRHEQILKSKGNGPEAIFEAYNLRLLPKVLNEAGDTAREILRRVEELKSETGLVQTIRNASSHGHGHAMFQYDKRGFFLSPEYLTNTDNPSARMEVGNLSGYLQRFYFSRIVDCLKEVSSDTSVLRERTAKDIVKAYVAERKSELGWNLRQWYRGFGPMLATVLTLGLSVNNCINQVPTTRHTDEQTRRQAIEFSRLQGRVEDTDSKIESILGQIEKIEADSAILYSYTNRPTIFNSEGVSNRVERLKRVARAIKDNSSQNP